MCNTAHPNCPYMDQPLVQEHQQLIFHNRMPIDEEILLTGVQEGFHAYSPYMLNIFTTNCKVIEPR